MATERSADIDLLRGLAMFLVVWGHMMQYTCLAGDPFADLLLRMIYMFHMPLFILISGYLSAFSRHTGLYGALRGRIAPLFRVLLVWNMLDYLLRFAYAEFLKMDTAFTWAGFIQSTVGGLWFVWAVIAYTMISAAAACLPRRWMQAVWYAGGAALLYLFPSTQNLLFLYPYYLLGRALARLPRPVRPGKIAGVSMLLCFLLTAVRFRPEHLVYTTGVDWWHSGNTAGVQLQIDLFRWWAGLCGCALVWAALPALRRLPDPVRRFLQACGRDSLWLYVVQRPTVAYMWPVSYSLLVRDYLGFDPLGASPLIFWASTFVLSAAGITLILLLRALLRRCPPAEKCLLP